MLNACSENQKHIRLYGSETEVIPLLNLFFTRCLVPWVSFKSQDHTTHQSTYSLVDLQLCWLRTEFYPALSELPSEGAGLCVR